MPGGDWEEETQGKVVSTLSPNRLCLPGPYLTLL